MMLGGIRSEMVEGNRHRARRRSPRIFAVAVMAAVSLGAAACSSGTGAATTTTLSPAASKTAIAAAYDTLFHLATGALDAKIAVVQDGAKLRSSLHAAQISSLAASSNGTKIDSVNPVSTAGCKAKSLPTPCEHVVYDVLGTDGTAILPMSQGYAVFVGGHWLVAKATICGLLGLFYNAEGKTGTPPGC
jgi:hypothetical protein